MTKYKLLEQRKHAQELMEPHSVLEGGGVSCHRCGKPASQYFNPYAMAAPVARLGSQPVTMLAICPECSPSSYQSWHYNCGKRMVDLLDYIEVLEWKLEDATR